jgi:general secretion pathway protein G
MRTTRKAFTLVEILIVVIILGILAAIVIPQFTEASNDARLSSLTSDLQTVRGQLELYKVQHLDTYPALATFEAQMTGTTDIAGDTDGTDFGPYLHRIPTNPFTNGNDVSAPDGDGDWEYNETTGAFNAAGAYSGY